MHKKIIVAAFAVGMLLTLRVTAEEAPAAAPAPEAAPAAAPAAPSLDQLFEQLLKFTPEEVKLKFEALKAEAAKMNADATGLRAQADALDAKAADLVARLKLLEELVAVVSAAPAPAADATAAPAEKEMAAAAPEAAPAEPAAPAAPEAVMEEAKADEKPRLNYAEHVMPIFAAKCASCHNQDKAKGDFAIDTFERVMQGGGSGAVVAAGDAAGSRLYRLLTHEEEPAMPMGGSKLDDASLAIIKQWIDDGALKDKNSKLVAVKKKASTEMVAAPVLAPGESPMTEKQADAKLAVLEGPLAIKAIASSPGAPVVAVSGYRQILFYHAETLELLRVSDFPEGVAECIKFSANGSVLLAAGGEAGKSGVAAVYDVRTGERLGEYGKTFDTVLTADISLDQTQIAVGLTNKKVRVYSTATGEQQYEITKHTDWVQAVAFSPDGWFLATGDRSGGLFVWQAETGRDMFECRGHTGAINTFDYRPDSNVLASAGADGQVRLWEMAEGKNIKNWGAHGIGVLSVRFARDGRIVTAGADQTTILWNGDGGKIADFPPAGDWAYSVCFAAQDSRILTGSWKGEVKVWEVAGAKEIGTLNLRSQ